MPPKDKDKQRERNKHHMRKVRAEAKLTKMSTGLPEQTQLPPSQQIDMEKISQLMGDLSQETWIARKVQLALTWMQISEHMAQDPGASKREMVVVGKAAMEVINANLSNFKPPRKGPRDGSPVAQADAWMMSDPTYCDLVKQLLIRRQTLKRERQAS